MSIYDRPRMGTSMAQVANASGSPGVRYPTGQYAARPSAGHKVPPPRVQAARRLQREVDAMSSQRLDQDMDARLRNAVADYQDRRDLVHRAVVSNVIAGTPMYSGTTGSGYARVRHAGPNNVLAHIFGL